jgi:2-octaprenyl-6-methoxyphenol hydroxylase
MTAHSNNADIAICGAGPVGLAFALLLIKRGVTPQRIALIDARALEPATRDPRSIAVSWGSRQLLEQIHGWPSAVTAINQIHVSRSGHFGRTLIDCKEHDLPSLGYVTRYGALVTALDAPAASAGLNVLRPARVTAIDEQVDGVTLQFADRAPLTAGIVVQAEGGLFSEQTAKAQSHDYRQTAIVAHIDCSAAMAQRAFERFTDEGPLAMLPQDEGYAMVWCVRPETAERLLALPASAFLSELQQAFGNRLGRFTDAGPRNAFALGLNAQPAATARTVAIGNAAQTLHPVAGQGLNLGLRDAAVLARLLAQDASPGKLAEFTQARSSDRRLTIRLTDVMARVFASAPQGAVSQTLLGLSLGAIDAVSPLKSLLAEQMMFGRR